MGPLLYLIYIADLPTTNNTTIAAFADDTDLLATNNNPVVASQHVSTSLKSPPAIVQQMESQNKPQKIRESYIHNKTYNFPAGYHQQYANTGSIRSKMLRLIHRPKTNMAETHQNKASEVKNLREIPSLLVRKSKLSIQNKFLLHKCIIKPIWTCGIQLWGCTKSSNTKIIQRLQSKILRSVINAPWYVSNFTLHSDLQIPFVIEGVHRLSTLYRQGILGHSDRLVAELGNPPNVRRRLRRQWPSDLQQPQMVKTKATNIPLQGLSECHQWMTSLFKTPPSDRTTIPLQDLSECHQWMTSLLKTPSSDRTTTPLQGLSECHQWMTSLFKTPPSDRTTIPLQDLSECHQ
jgi:hypothetical protein